MSLDFCLERVQPCQVFSRNITHNLNNMAEAAGIYKCLWRPDENGYETAGQIVPLLQDALKDLKARPEHYKQFDAQNGWGTYPHFVSFVEDVLSACQEHPDAKIEVSR
jgi:hypothetical protein